MFSPLMAPFWIMWEHSGATFELAPWRVCHPFDMIQESFFGKLLLHITVFAILLIRSTDDLEKYKDLLDEATFYDKQWNATWEGQVRPSEQEKSQ
jgi:hypothetical protein